MKMKNVVWDYARKRKAAVRGGGAHRVDIDEVLADLRHNGLGTVDVAPDELLFLEQLLSKLQARNQRDSDFVDLYYFAGLSQAEIAARFGLTEEAVKDRLKVIRLWLRKEILRAHNVDRLTSS
jgi:RNA polymerase sigma factor (sigma-70 family)